MNLTLSLISVNSDWRLNQFMIDFVMNSFDCDQFLILKY